MCPALTVRADSNQARLLAIEQEVRRLTTTQNSLMLELRDFASSTRTSLDTLCHERQLSGRGTRGVLPGNRGAW